MASYVAASRLSENQHFLSDVVFGAAIGIAAGRTVTFGTGSTRFEVSPMATPGASRRASISVPTRVPVTDQGDARPCCYPHSCLTGTTYQIHACNLREAPGRGPTAPNKPLDRHDHLLGSLGSALFIVVAFVPAVLLGAYFFDGFTVHYVVVPASIVIFLLLWAASIFRATATD